MSNLGHQPVQYLIWDTVTAWDEALNTAKSFLIQSVLWTQSPPIIIIIFLTNLYSIEIKHNYLLKLYIELYIVILQCWLWPVTACVIFLFSFHVTHLQTSTKKILTYYYYTITIEFSVSRTVHIVKCSPHAEGFPTELHPESGQVNGGIGHSQTLGFHWHSLPLYSLRRRREVLMSQKAKGS